MKTNELYKKIRNNISKVIIGKQTVIDLLCIALITEGNILIDDVPGTGKTVLVKTFAKSIGLSYNRVQFTPDLLPSDITGINYFNMKTSEFEFLPGPIFSNIILADEINRATPKTQSGLLECMEEKQVTIDGSKYNLPYPSMILATQNPIENNGTFSLPEAQMDRFLFKVKMDYPTIDEGVRILARFNNKDPLTQINSCVEKQDIIDAIMETKNVYICEDLMHYIINIIEATRRDSRVLLGVSPRGALALMKAAKGYAIINNRNYVIPEDIKKVSHPVLEHRIILNSYEELKDDIKQKIIDEILDSIAVPTEKFYNER